MFKIVRFIKNSLSCTFISFSLLPIYLTSFFGRGYWVYKLFGYYIYKIEEVFIFYCIYMVILFKFNKKIEKTLSQFCKANQLPLLISFILTIIVVCFSIESSMYFLLSKCLIIWSISGIQMIKLNIRSMNE